MKLEREFYKLPLCFDVERLRAELGVFAESDWQEHPSDYKGNFAVPLISVNGGINDDFAGPMEPTPHLERSPYMQQVIASFRSVFSRSRLMRLEGRHDVPLHSDINYHWWSRVRIHVPIVTTPDVIFHCGDEQVHMAPGEAWIFDAWKMHTVVNPSGNTRVHLVIDTTGSPDFWSLVRRARPYPAVDGDGAGDEAEFIAYESDRPVRVDTERYNIPVVMSPGEVEEHVRNLVGDVTSVPATDVGAVRQFVNTIRTFSQAWRTIWSVHGPEPSGWPAYEALVSKTRQQLFSVDSPLLSNKSVAAQVMTGRVLMAAFNPGLAQVYGSAGQSEERPASTASVTTKAAQPGVAQSGVGRNSPCPCGSGKKYKRCHGR